MKNETAEPLEKNTLDKNKFTQIRKSRLVFEISVNNYYYY